MLTLWCFLTHLSMHSATSSDAFSGYNLQSIWADLGSVMTCKPRTYRFLCQTLIVFLLLYSCSAFAMYVATCHTSLRLHSCVFNNVDVPTCQSYGAASCSDRMHASLLANEGLYFSCPCSRLIVSPHACKPCPHPCDQAGVPAT